MYRELQQNLLPLRLGPLAQSPRALTPSLTPRWHRHETATEVPTLRHHPHLPRPS